MTCRNIPRLRGRIAGIPAPRYLSRTHRGYILLSGYNDDCLDLSYPLRADDRAGRLHTEPDDAAARETRAHCQRTAVGSAASAIHCEPPPEGPRRPRMGGVASRWYK